MPIIGLSAVFYHSITEMKLTGFIQLLNMESVFNCTLGLTFKVKGQLEGHNPFSTFPLQSRNTMAKK